MKKKIHFIYSSPGGNTELVSKFVANILQESEVQLKIENCSLVNIATLLASDEFIFACPTYGHGEWEKEFEKFTKKIAHLDFSGKKCALIGLGDRKYDTNYTVAIIMLMKNFFTKIGFGFIGFPLAIVGAPIPLLEKLASPWAKKLVGLLSQKS